MFKRSIKLMGLTAAAVGLTLSTTPGAAQANHDVQVCWDNSSGQRAGCAYLDTYGEVLTVTDTAADGWGTRAQIQRYDNGYWYWHSTECFDDTNQGSPETTCNYNVAEGTTIRVVIWASQNGVYKNYNYSENTTA